MGVLKHLLDRVDFIVDGRQEESNEFISFVVFLMKFHSLQKSRHHYLCTGRGNINRRDIVVIASSSTQEVNRSTSVLRQAAKDKSVNPKEVFNALRTLEKAKLQNPEWPKMVGGSSSPGKRWRLVFTTGTSKVREALKGNGEGGGNYFPLTAAQRWDASNGEIENGIFLGLLASLTFKGPYSFTGKKLNFDFDTLKLRIGPLKFEFRLKEKLTDYKADPKDPFFIIFYVDEDIIAARGRGGGIAFWSICPSDFDMKHLI